MFALNNQVTSINFLTRIVDYKLTKYVVYTHAFNNKNINRENRWKGRRDSYQPVNVMKVQYKAKISIKKGFW